MNKTAIQCYLMMLTVIVGIAVPVQAAQPEISDAELKALRAQYREEMSKQNEREQENYQYFERAHSKETHSASVPSQTCVADGWMSATARQLTTHVSQANDQNWASSAAT